MSSKRGRRIDGILLLDKPVGITSTHALNRAKHVFYARRGGHTGSLDPLASGLLPLCFGEATKISAFLLDAEKRYVVEARLGTATDTADADGEVIETATVPALDAGRVEAVLEGFRGSIEQIPPMYSALKHQGERLYTLARKGVTVEREPRPVTIYKLLLRDLGETSLGLEVHCSKGTYVRTLVEDIARALGTVGHVSALRRTGVAGFGTDDAWVTLEALEADENPQQWLLAPDTALQQWPAMTLNRDLAHFFRHGQPVQIARAPTAGFLRLYGEGVGFLGVGEVLDDGRVAPRRLMSTAAA
ncbi:MAG: tRNA pseudouridine(55) synthase TruB [Gammaproteobacteria bacterium]